MSCCERQIEIDLVADDTAPPLSLRFPDLDLSTYSAIKFRIKYEDGSRQERDVVPVGVGDPEAGTVTWQAGDLVFGQHQADIEFSDGSGSFCVPRRFPILLNVRRAL